MSVRRPLALLVLLLIAAVALTRAQGMDSDNGVDNDSGAAEVPEPTPEERARAAAAAAAAAAARAREAARREARLAEMAVNPETDPAPPGFTVMSMWRPADCRGRVARGDEVQLMYTARIAQRGSASGVPGEMFDSTATPVLLHARGDALITGLYRGILGACVREKRQITIPPIWGYGVDGFHTVPGNATTLWDVEIFDTAPLVDQFAKIDSDEDGCVTQPEIASWLLKQGVREALAPAVSARMMAHDDINEDGVLVCTEFSGSKVCRDHNHKPCARAHRSRRAGDDDDEDDEDEDEDEEEAEAPAVIDAMGPNGGSGRGVNTLGLRGADFAFL